MASEDRTKFLSVLLVLCVAFQVFAGTTAAVIQQDGGERSAALRAPKLCVQLLRGAPHVSPEYGIYDFLAEAAAVTL